MFWGTECRGNEGFPKPDTECKLGDIGFRYEILWTRLKETLETEWEQIYSDKDVFKKELAAHNFNIKTSTLYSSILCLCL